MGKINFSNRDIRSTTTSILNALFVAKTIRRWSFMKLLQFLQYKKSVQDTSPSKDFSLRTLELKTGYTHSRGNMGSVLQICFFTGFDFLKVMSSMATRMQTAYALLAAKKEERVDFIPKNGCHEWKLVRKQFVTKIWNNQEIEIQLLSLSAACFRKPNL